MLFSRRSFQPKDWTWVCSIAGRFFTIWATVGAALKSIRDKSQQISTPLTLAFGGMVWLILCFSLTGLGHVQITDKTLFLAMSVRMFLEEISIGINRLSKKDGPHRWGLASSNLSRAWIEQKVGERENLLSLLELGHPSSLALRHQRSWFQ